MIILVKTQLQIQLKKPKKKEKVKAEGNHFECAGSGESGEAVTTEKLTGSDTHDRWGTFGSFGEHGVAHGLVDLLWVLYRNSFI